MLDFEVSETGVWRVSGKGNPNSQTDTQTVIRHLLINGNENKAMQVSDEVSEGVCHPLNCHCLSGGVSLGRATPDTPDESGKGGRK